MTTAMVIIPNPKPILAAILSLMINIDYYPENTEN
jgi:hypothetical protein